MISLVSRALARTCLLAVVLVATTAISPQSRAADESAGVALELDEAAALAVSDQPLLERLEARRRAARAAAVAAGQLPDPQLVFGLAELPVNGGDAYSFRRDSDTQLQLALTQEFPTAGKRRLRGALLDREASRLTAEQQLTQRGVRREAALAWLELWRYDQARQLARASLREAQTQLQAAEIALKTGAATQAEYLAARQEVHRLQDAQRGAEQSIGHAANALSRWIGAAAFRPVCPDLPELRALPPLEAVLARISAHPQRAEAAAQLAATRTGAELARAAYRPDWRLELAYGERPAYSELLSLQVGIDLPLFTRRRQDQGLAAALAEQDAAEQGLRDSERQLLAEARLNHQDYQLLQRRLDEYRQTLLPQGEARIEAALAGWRSGRGLLREVLDARLSELELRMARLELQHDLAKHFVQLDYLGAFAAAPVLENDHE